MNWDKHGMKILVIWNIVIWTIVLIQVLRGEL